MTPEQIKIRYEKKFINNEYMLKKRLNSFGLSFRELKIYYSEKNTILFNFDCVNEAILNALIHNDWTITEPQISMFHDRLEILSHGGLPIGMTKEQFFDGTSKPRNATLMRIFLNMGLTEHTGHGIPTIVEKYGRDVFQIESNYIRCTIPFDKEVIDQIDNKNVGLNVGLNVALNKTEKKVIEVLIENPSVTSVELAEIIGVTKRTIERTFKSLQEKKMIERIGSKRDGNWIVVK
ncbi:ATP-binding protein [Pseudoramibacter alactolyticus]